MPEATPVPPASAKSMPAPQGHTREQGIAMYERIRKQLRDLIHQKRHHDKQLDNIFKAETTYLEETQNGNIIKGFDNYIKGGVTRRKTTFNDCDRIFSLSSLTYASRLQQEHESTPVTAASTPTVPDLPRISMAQLQKNKKNPNRKRKADDESESVSEVETPGPKRVRISFSGQGHAVGTQ